MKTHRIAAAVLLTLLPATVSLPAVAQDDAVTIQARARFKEGVEAFDRGKFEEARLSFLQAYALKKHPAVLLNLAQSSAKSNHALEAAKYFQQFLREATTATAAQKRDAESGLTEVRQKIGRIDVVAPAGTEISLDDQGKVGTLPFEPLDVDVGTHTVKSPTQSVIVTAVAGQRVEAKLGAAATPPVAPAPAPTTTATPAPPPKDDPPEPPPKRTNLLSPPKDMVPVYAGLGVGGVGFVSAIVFAIFKADAQSKANAVAREIRTAALERGIQAQGACNNPSAPEFDNACKTLTDNNDKVDTNAAIANVSIGVGVAGLLFAGIWYLAAPKENKAGGSTSWLTPYGGRRNVGLAFTF